MDRASTLRKIKAYKKNPNLIKEPSMEEMADLVVLVIDAVQQIEVAIKEHRLDGKTPVGDKDYLTKDTTLKLINNAVRDILNNHSQLTSQAQATFDKKVNDAVANLQHGLNGKDAEITDAHIKQAAKYASSLIKLPDFDSLITEAFSTKGKAIRNTLERLAGDERYKVEIADVQGLKDALDQLAIVRAGNGGGLGRRQVFEFIRQAIADGTISSGDSLPTQTGNNGKFLTTDGTEASWAALAGGGDMAAATYDPQGISDDAFDRANHTGTQTASTISDFAAEVKTAAGTSQESADIIAMRGTLWLNHDLSGLTVSDKTVTWPDKDGTVAMLDDITGGGAVDSVNSQTGVVVLDADDIDDTSTTNKFATAAELSKLAGIEASADVTDTANVTSAGALMDSELTDIVAVKALADTDGTGVNTGTSTTHFITPAALNNSLYRKVTISSTEPVSPEDGDIWVDTSTLYFSYSAELNVLHQSQHTQYLDGVSSSEVLRYTLPSGQALVLTGIEVAQRGGGTTDSDFTVQIYDVTNAAQLAICSLNAVSSLSVTTDPAIVYSIRVTNSTGTDIDACFSVRGYYVYA